MKRNNYNPIGKLIAVIIIGICIGCGIAYGISSIYYILPIIILLLIIATIYENSQSTSKKITFKLFVQGSLVVAIIIFILVGFGSCFHVEQHNSMKQRIEMGLPMY